MLDLLLAAENQQNLCVLAVLTWIASCDGAMDDGELELLRSMARGVPGAEEILPAVVEVARRGQPEDLEVACRYLRNRLPRAQRPLMLQVFVTMAARDGRLTVAENHILRFLADLLGKPVQRFARLFQQVTGRPFPEVGDVSSPQWWQRREAGEQAKAPADGWGADKRGSDGGARRAQGAAPAKPGMSRSDALRIFALEEGASTEQIRSAYRRLAKARHPDRFAGLGPAAQATATAAFVIVKQAYDVLCAA